MILAMVIEHMIAKSSTYYMENGYKKCRRRKIAYMADRVAIDGSSETSRNKYLFLHLDLLLF